MMDRALFRFALLLSFQQVYLRARRSVAAFAGIAGGIVLVMMQLGFQGALYDSAVRLHHSLDGEIIVVAREFRSIQDLTWFSREWLVGLRAHPAVASAAPLYLSPIAVRSISDHAVRTLLGIGIDLGEPALRLDQLAADTTGLRVPGRILFDRKSQLNYGDIIGGLARAGSVEIETAFLATPLQSALTVIGDYTLGGTIVYYGTALLSAATLSSVTGQPLQRVNVGVVKLREAAEPLRVVRELRSLLPQEAVAMTAADFVQLERRFWKNETPIGFLFDIGAAIGFLISATYIYQVLFQITEENLPEYAVLKTMGYPPAFFIIVVVSTAVMLAIAALLPALLLSQFLYWICIRATQLDLHLTPVRVSGVGGLAILIAAGSGWLAARRLSRVDPAALM
jgi:putative ABC transport system permease protein